MPHKDAPYGTPPYSSNGALTPPTPPRPSTGGRWRVVLGIVVLVLVLVGSMGATKAGSNDPAYLVGLVGGRLLVVAIGIWLIIAGRRRLAEARRLTWETNSR